MRLATKSPRRWRAAGRASTRSTPTSRTSTAARERRRPERVAARVAALDDRPRQRSAGRTAVAARTDVAWTAASGRRHLARWLGRGDRCRSPAACASRCRRRSPGRFLAGRPSLGLLATRGADVSIHRRRHAGGARPARTDRPWRDRLRDAGSDRSGPPRLFRRLVGVQPRGERPHAATVSSTTSPHRPPAGRSCRRRDPKTVIRER